jgi:hypothetical protein
MEICRFIAAFGSDEMDIVLRLQDEHEDQENDKNYDKEGDTT